MPNVKIAHIREREVDLIIVPLVSRFGSAPPKEKRATIADLQERAASANLAGGVVPVWDAGGDRMVFVAPPQWHPFFTDINLNWVMANIKLRVFLVAECTRTAICKRHKLRTPPRLVVLPSRE